MPESQVSHAFAPVAKNYQKALALHQNPAYKGAIVHFPVQRSRASLRNKARRQPPRAFFFEGFGPT
jgi:hypothetical protein